ncbi:MAG: hypothetical protein WCI01_03320 [Chlorobiaceae bacterium]
MYTKEELLGFFNSLMGYEQGQRDLLNDIALGIDDARIKDILHNIAADEQRHMGHVAHIIAIIEEGLVA